MNNFPYRVALDGEVIPADVRAEGFFELEKVNGRKELWYCARCSDPSPNRDGCLASQYMSDNHVFVNLAQFQ